MTMDVTNQNGQLALITGQGGPSKLNILQT